MDGKVIRFAEMNGKDGKVYFEAIEEVERDFKTGKWRNVVLGYFLLSQGTKRKRYQTFKEMMLDTIDCYSNCEGFKPYWDAEFETSNEDEHLKYFDV